MNSPERVGLRSPAAPSATAYHDGLLGNAPPSWAFRPGKGRRNRSAPGERHKPRTATILGVATSATPGTKLASPMSGVHARAGTGLGRGPAHRQAAAGVRDPRAPGKGRDGEGLQGPPRPPERDPRDQVPETRAPRTAGVRGSFSP